MLKVYKVHNYVSIDGAHWREVVQIRLADDCWIASYGVPAYKYILFDKSFNEVREYLNNNNLDGIRNDYTFWRHNPIINVRYFDTWDDVKYRHFDHMFYKREFEEWTNVSFEWLAKYLPADQFIQYLKERGITTCPMNF